MLHLPVDFENRMKCLLGDEWDDFLQCYSEDRYQGLRFNPLKVRRDPQIRGGLAETAGIRHPEPVPWAEDGIYYGADEERPGKHPYHEMGLYYIQEPSAMSAAALLAPQPGMKVLDLCAAPGGKTTQLAGFLQNKGLLVANEINSQRASILSQNVERMGIRNCLVTNADSFALAAHFGAFFHAILVDAPCSGEGMFRKNPQAMEEWSPANVRLCAERQKEILENAAAMLLPGGRLVYSTCTFAPEENENSIAGFLKRHPEFHVLKTEAPWFSPAHPEWIESDICDDPVICESIRGTFRLWPHNLHGEGHYAAVLEKDGSLPPFSGPASDTNIETDSKADTKKASRVALKTLSTASVLAASFRRDPDAALHNGKGKGGRQADRKADMKGKGRQSDSGRTASGPQEKAAAIGSFLQETLNAEAITTLFAGKKLLEFGDHIYLLPDTGLSLTGLTVLRAGLQLGEYKKDRFEPSHSLAMALSPDEVQITANLHAGDARAAGFFNGEAVSLTEEDFPDGVIPQKGWALFCIDGYSAGWGKISNHILKNHYPKGLRRKTEWM